MLSYTINNTIIPPSIFEPKITLHSNSQTIIYNDLIEMKKSIKNLEKHKIYENKYGKNAKYWGLGIENEVYLEMVDNPTKFTKADFLIKHKYERYSVDYFANYNPVDLRMAMVQTAEILDNSGQGIEMPVLLKSHSFSKTDSENQPKTQYTKLCEPNPLFSGKTLLDTLAEIDPEYFGDDMNGQWIFDGDTVEFPTRNFYNATLGQVLTELADAKRNFEERLNNALDKIPNSLISKMRGENGRIQIMTKNHPFATYATNLKNVAMFNNGTLHYNITLPTDLDENSQILDRPRFIQQHKEAIKVIQWIEPFMLAAYGSPDPFSQYCGDNPMGQRFGAASQRCAISRYIGVGTYDTDTMETGKILTKPLANLPFVQDGWFGKYYQNNAYNLLSELGLDINFNKHYNHGIEIRFLDHLTNEEDIAHSFEFLVYLMDYVLDRPDIIVGNPNKSAIWNGLMLRVMKEGTKCELSSDELIFFQGFFGFSTPFSKTNILDVYNLIFVRLIARYTEIGDLDAKTYNSIGPFSSLVLPNNISSGNQCLYSRFRTIRGLNCKTYQPCNIL